MSIKVTYRNGVFEPVEDVTDLRPGQNYTAFSDDELAEIRSTIGLQPGEKSFEFGNNSADDEYDDL
jgi:predicted DNA-binding antitoxin AbrB/MazE fold protein